MNILELNERLKGKEAELNQFDFKFISDFIPVKAVFAGISVKEGFPGNINGNFIIEGYIKGFKDFPVKAFRIKKFFENNKNVFNILELKESLEKVFEEGEYIDLEENGIIDLEKNVIFLDKIKTVPDELIKTMESMNKKKKIKTFISLTEKLIEIKIELKILKFLEDSKPKLKADVPDELRDFISPSGTLIEPRPSFKKYPPKEKPDIDIKIRGISKIPSIKSIVKKTKEGKNLNFIENLINEKLTDYLVKDTNIQMGIKLLNKELLKTSFQRETIRDFLKKENISALPFKDKIHIDGKEFETKITITKNNFFTNIDKEKDKEEKYSKISF